MRSSVVAFNRLDATDFARYERLSGATDLETSDIVADGRRGYLLASAPNGPRTWLTWKAPGPGRALVDKLFLPVAGLTILLLGLSLAAGRVILSNAKVVSATATDLAAAHCLLSTALEAADEGFIISHAGRVKFWNSSFLRLTGIEAIGPGESAAENRKTLLQNGFAIIDGDVERFLAAREEGQWLATNAQAKILSLRRLAIPNGFMMLLRDITTDREVQQDLIAAHHEAQRANQVKSQFLAQMSHELRTPLNAILGFSEVISLGLFGKVEPKVYGDYAGSILGAGRHLLNLVNDVLDISKIEAGKMTASLEQVGIAKIAEDVRILVGAKAEAKGISLKLRGESGVEMNADPRMLKQILLNLLSNAVKFTPAGGSIDVIWRRTLDGMAETVVTDTGIGMTDEDLALALTPFGQARGKKEPGEEAGTGLGLPIVAGLCKAQGGTFSIESMPGMGTTAVVRLPLEQSAAA